MKITEFGKIVRKARLDVEVSLLSMAKELQVTSSFLSGMETGRKKITVDCVQKLKHFLRHVALLSTILKRLLMFLINQ